MDLAEREERITEAYTCSDCGAVLKYKPGTDTLVCEYCGGVNKITPTDDRLVEELDYQSFLKTVGDENLVSEKVIECKNCGASSCVQGNLKSLFCPHCSSPLIEADIHEERLIRPAALLPFIVEHQEVYKKLSRWVNGLWFTPNDMEKTALSPIGLQGVYIPYWTYDAETISHYSGQRGENYAVSVGTGDNRRTETRTKWYGASGTVYVPFDDIMIPASGNLGESTLRSLEPWDKDRLIAISNEYLSGFITEKYKINLEQGFNSARGIMERSIKREIRYDIGGDQQRIHSVSTQYNAISFKHILVPVYMSSYRYKNKLYHFYVNGRNGKITGDRPYSIAKIVFLILFIILISIAVYFLIK